MIIQFFDKAEGMVDGLRSEIVPRVGEYIMIGSYEYIIRKIRWRLEGPWNVRIYMEYVGSMDLD